MLFIDKQIGGQADSTFMLRIDTFTEEIYSIVKDLL